MHYQQRTIEQNLTNLIEQNAVTGLMGPTGAGKTTLLVNSLPEHTYINFDEPRTLLRYRQDPQRFLRQLNHNTIFDEVQHAPDLITQLIGQEEPEQHHVMVSSCRFQHIRGLEKTNIENLQTITLLPYQLTEVPNQLREKSVYLGAFPALVAKHFQQADNWFATYIQQNLLKQLPAIGMVSDQNEFQRLLHLLAANTAKPINLSHYANQLDVDVKTIKRWVQLLASSFIIFLMPPYHDDFGKRTIKSPKLYFYDTGLVSYLTGIETAKQFEFGPMAAQIFENYVVMEILKKTIYAAKQAEFYYLSTNHGVSVELIIEQDGQRQFYCIRFNETFRIRMLQPIESFITPNDKGFLIYIGADMPYREHIQVCNISTYLHS